MESTRVNRRAFLGGAAAASLSAGVFPATLRAQPRTVKVGMVEPLTGPDGRRGPGLASGRPDGGGGDQRRGRDQVAGGRPPRAPRGGQPDQGGHGPRGGGAAHQRGRSAPHRLVSLGARGHHRSPRPAAAYPFHHRHHRGRPAHREYRQVRSRGAAEAPVRVPHLPGQRDLREERRPLHDGHLQGSGSEPEARGRHVLQRPLRQDADGELSRRAEGGQSGLRGGRGDPLPGERGGSLHRGEPGQGGQARHHRAGDPARHRHPPTRGAGQAAAWS